MDSVSKTIYGAGHASLDRDHAVLFEILERLKRPQIDLATMVDLSTELLAHLDAHFEHEEELMDRYRYMAAAEHKKAHRQFRSDADSLARMCVEPGVGVDTLVEQFEGWIEAHICGADAHLAEFLRTRHLAPGDADFGFFVKLGILPHSKPKD